MTLTVSKEIITFKNVDESINAEYERKLLEEVGGKMWILNGGNGGTYYLGTCKHHRMYSDGYHQNYWYFDKHERDYRYCGSFAELKQAIDEDCEG